MLREVFPIIIALCISLTGGIYSADYVTARFDGFDKVQYGVWTAHPKLGTPSADAYAIARAARTGKIALGGAEGLSFTAQTDIDGAPLMGNCDYVIKGNIPAARYWTLYATDKDLHPLPKSKIADSGLYSGNVRRNTDGSLDIDISNKPMPGNWLRISGDKPIFLFLNLYDTGIATSTGAKTIAMPKIIRKGCAIG